MKHILGLLLVVITLSACEKVTLLQELDQQDTNEIMVVLNKHGIEAKKVTVTAQNKTSWSVQVAAEDEERASLLLVEIGLPRKKELGLAGVCQDPGMIPTPMMEKCQKLLATKGEIINALQSIPGVVRADVVLNIPDKEEFIDENAPIERPSASVVVQIRDAHSVGDSFSEEKIQRFVSRAVTGLDPRDVSVIISALVRGDETQTTDEISDENDVQESHIDENQSADIVSIGNLKVSKDSRKTLVLGFVLLAFVFIVLFIAVIYTTIKLMKLKKMANLSTIKTDKGLNQVTSGDENPQLPSSAGIDEVMQDMQDDDEF